jgi:hypothetical protein
VSAKIGVSRLKSVFSRILESSGRRLIGRYDINVCWVFAWFSIRYNLPYLPVARKVFEFENCIVDLRYCTEAFPGKFFEDFACD